MLQISLRRIAVVLIAVMAMGVAAPALAHQWLDYFEPGETHLSAQGYRVAREVAAYAARSPSRILITGHADGAEAATRAAEQPDLWRAAEMMLELMRLGVPPSAISIEAKGDSQLARVVAAGAAEPLNRRVMVDVNPLPPPVQQTSRPAGAPPPPPPPPPMRSSHLDQPLIFFGPGSTELDRNAMFRLALAVNGHKPGDWRMIVRGNADTLGSISANEALSFSRAEAEGRALVRLGMPWADIELSGAGERELMRATPDERAEPLNRRVTVYFFLKPGVKPGER